VTDPLDVPVPPSTCVRTLRFKVRSEAYPWLNRAAREVNVAWNWANEVSYKAARPYSGAGKWLSGFDLCHLSSGATHYFDYIGADTLQRIVTEYAAKRNQAKKPKLRWRANTGPRRALGWIPVKSASLRRRGRYLRFCGKTVRVFERERFAEITRWGCGCFAEDAIGDGYLCLPCEIEATTPAAILSEVGIDLGLKDIAVTSEGERLCAADFFRGLEQKIAEAQRRAHRRQAQRLHRKAKRRRHHALHQFSRRIINRYKYIAIGDVSSQALRKTGKAKAVLDSGWGMLKSFLQYKGQQSGRRVDIVSERNTSRTCSLCGSLTGPKGVNGLRVRSWMCSGCGATHDRDVNAARNILAVGRSPPSVVGNEPAPQLAPPSRASRPRKARIARDAAAA